MCSSDLYSFAILSIPIRMHPQRLRTAVLPPPFKQPYQVSRLTSSNRSEERRVGEECRHVLFRSLFIRDSLNTNTNASAASSNSSSSSTIQTTVSGIQAYVEQ